MQYQYYTDTIIEYNLCLKRLAMLEGRREELYTKYFGVKSPTIDRIGARGTAEEKDKMVAYLDEYESPHPPMPSLKEQIEKLQYEKKNLQVVIKDMQKQLANVKSIEGRLYYLIAVDQYSINKAVEKVSEEFYMSEANIWKTYYKNIKAEIRKLRK